MLANILNICSDEELENDGTHVDDGMFIFHSGNLYLFFIFLLADMTSEGK
jgi:hypothetical protein